MVGCGVAGVSQGSARRRPRRSSALGDGLPVTRCVLAVQVRAEDGVHPSEVPRRPAAARHSEFLSHDPLDNRRQQSRAPGVFIRDEDAPA